LVGRDELPRRLARNEVFTYWGNVIFAISAGVIGTVVARAGIFYAAAIFAAEMADAVVFIREGEVNYEAARGGGRRDGHSPTPRRSARDQWRPRDHGAP
jgi:hypothetical protein